jgi:hypothetical protein
VVGRGARNSYAMEAYTNSSTLVVAILPVPSFSRSNTTPTNAKYETPHNTNPIEKARRGPRRMIALSNPRRNMTRVTVARIDSKMSDDWVRPAIPRTANESPAMNHRNVTFGLGSIVVME